LHSFASLTVSDLWIERAERDLCKGLSFSVQSGDVVRILGENGAGKSSLLKVIVSPSALHEVLECLELIDHIDVPVKKLSAGQARRVALARLWLSKKTLWLLDEPFASLDVRGVELLEACIRQHASVGGLVLLTTHQDLPSLSTRDVALLS